MQKPVPRLRPIKELWAESKALALGQTALQNVFINKTFIRGSHLVARATKGGSEAY